MIEDASRLWERQRWDTDKSFHVFHEYYLAQEAPRSLIHAYRQYREATAGPEQARNRPHHLPGEWKHWAQGQTSRGQPIPGAASWQDRAQAWEEHLSQQDREHWEARRTAQREEEWEVKGLLLAKGKAVLEDARAFIRHKFFYDKDGAITREEIELLTGAAITAIELSSKLARLAAEMPTNVTKQELSEREPLTLRVVERIISVPAETALGAPDALDALGYQKPEPENDG